jgi:hypothetical protein
VGGRKLRVRLLPEIKLYEYSPVIWGMNSATSTVGVKAVGGSELESPTLGDILYGAVVPAFNRRADSLLERGLVTAEEHGTLLDAGREVAKGIKGAVPSGIHDRRTDSPVSSPAYYYMAGGGPDEEKVEEDSAESPRTETPPGTIGVGPSGSDHPNEPTPTGPGEGAGVPDEDLLLQVEIGLSEIAL